MAKRINKELMESLNQIPKPEINDQEHWYAYFEELKKKVYHYHQIETYVNTDDFLYHFDGKPFGLSFQVYEHYLFWSDNLK